MTTVDKARFSRRAFLQWAGVGAATAVLAACAQPAAPTQPAPTLALADVAALAQSAPTQASAGETAVPEPTAAPPPAPAGPVTLEVFWSDWGEEWDKPMEELGKSYTAEHPSVKLDWTFLAEWREKLVTRVAAGDPPDVSYINADSQASMASKGSLVALDDYAAQAGLARDKFVISMWDQCLWEGKLFAVPGGADFIAMFYSKTAYREADLDPEAPPKTVTELTEHSLKLLKKDSSGNLDRIGYGPYNYELADWAFIFGGEWYDPQLKKVTANDPKNVEALEWLVEYVGKLGAENLTSFQASQPDQWSPGNPFMTGRSAYLLDGYWQGAILDQGAPDLEYGVAFYPTINGTPEERKRYKIGGWMVALPVGGKNLEPSWQFVKYAFVDNSWKMGCDTVNGCTVLDQMEQFTTCVIDKIGKENRMAKDFHVFGDTGTAGTKCWPVMKVNALYNDELARAYDAAVSGQKTPKQALDELTELIQKELDKA